MDESAPERGISIGFLFGSWIQISKLGIVLIFASIKGNYYLL